MINRHIRKSRMHEEYRLEKGEKVINNLVAIKVEAPKIPVNNMHNIKQQQEEEEVMPEIKPKLKDILDMYFKFKAKF